MGHRNGNDTKQRTKAARGLAKRGPAAPARAAAAKPGTQLHPRKAWSFSSLLYRSLALPWLGKCSLPTCISRSLDFFEGICGKELRKGTLLPGGLK